MISIYDHDTRARWPRPASYTWPRPISKTTKRRVKGAYQRITLHDGFAIGGDVGPTTSASASINDLVGRARLYAAVRQLQSPRTPPIAAVFEVLSGSATVRHAVGELRQSDGAVPASVPVLATSSILA